MRWRTGLAGGLLVCASLSLFTGCTQSAPSTTPTSDMTARDLTCLTTITPAPLPTWAADGFSPTGRQSEKQVHGVSDLILGVVFGDPLRAPNVAGHGNKILWVTRPLNTRTESSRDPNLKIHATLNGTSTVVDRVIAGGPGPSRVDLPRAGCWTFNLSWSGHSDRLALLYR
jgi:hypothetical protein